MLSDCHFLTRLSSEFCAPCRTAGISFDSSPCISLEDCPASIYIRSEVAKNNLTYSRCPNDGLVFELPSKKYITKAYVIQKKTKF